MKNESRIPNPNSRVFVSRRDLLKAGGALVVSFSFRPMHALAVQSPAPAGRPAAGKPLDGSEVDSFLAVHADGTVTVYTGKADVGTGLRIAVAQMAAEELGISADRVTVIDGDTGLCPDQGGTGGSTGLTQGGAGVRRAAATARQALLQIGAERLGRPASELTIVDGEVRPTAGGTGAGSVAGVGIGALVGGRAIARKVDPNAPLIAASNYKVVGRALPRPDVPAKVTATHEYVQNVSVPGMLHARVIRPPAIGATLVSVDEASIRSIPNVRVVRIKNFLAVVAPDEWAAVRAATTLKANWTEGRTLPSHAELESYLRNGAVDRDQAVTNRGDIAAGLASATKKLSATYFWPNQSHASLGPSCSVADVRADGSATIWSASQGTHGLRTTLARVFGLAPEKTRVVFLEGSGSYGTNGGDFAAADAVLLSKTVGAPVRVQWMRQDEHRWDPKGPQQLIDIQGGLDESGKIVAWDVQMWVPTNRMGARALLAADAAGLAQDDGQNAGAVTQNGEPPYDAPNVRVVAHLMRDTPVAVSNLRAPGKIANVFAVESFVDELAVLAGADPLEFRLRRLSDPRAVEALTRTAQSFNWQTRPSPNPQARQGNLLVGRGIAYMRYKQAENYVAMAMEVTVDPSSGKIVVSRVTCAHDCGLIVNPDALRNQVEGCIVQTLSRALHEEVTFERGRVSSADWSTYPVLTFNEVPTIDVILLNRTDQPIIGAGEAATAPVAGALANAVFDATGARLRTVPFTPERVKAALAARTRS